MYNDSKREEFEWTCACAAAPYTQCYKLHECSFCVCKWALSHLRNDEDPELTVFYKGCQRSSVTIRNDRGTFHFTCCANREQCAGANFAHMKDKGKLYGFKPEEMARGHGIIAAECSFPR